VNHQGGHGSVAEETAALFEALRDAGSTWSRSASHDHPGSTATPLACRVCPLCQFVALVQNVRPETVQHLADAAASLAAAASDLAAGVAARSSGAGAAQHPPDGQRRPHGPPGAGAPAGADDVQHIDITD
jgi:hypothetical protein